MRAPVMSAVLLSFLLVLSVGVTAQTSTTSVRGTVTDKSGAAIASAKVTLSNPQRGFERSTTTGPAGGYEFLQLTPATYILTVEAPGFRKSIQTNVELLVSTPATLNVMLQVGAISETVEVSAEGEIVNTTDASLGNAFNEHQVKELPLEGRSVPELLSLQAGVTYTGNRADIDKNVDTRSGAVNGAHSDQSNITLDGVDVNDQVNGYAFTSVLPVTLDSVQEFRVTTSNYNADQGRSSGAQVSLVTKGGTNKFHGSLYEYHRNTITSANDWFIKQSQVANGQPNQPPKLIRNIFGGSVGGPIWKDRLFFFVNYEGYRQREETSALRIVPSESMRDGVIVYQCEDPTQCPGGPVQGIAASHTIPAGFKGLSPTQTQTMDPLGIGLNSVVMSYLNSFPLPNDTSAGDNFNYVGYRFRGPVPTNNNWYIARADFKLTRSGTHSIFWRGALRNDAHANAPYLPGTAALHTLADYSKGFTVGYTASLRPTLLNNFRWGYTRQSSGDIGNNDSQPFIFFRGLNDDSTSNQSSLAVTRSQSFQAPVHNFVDDMAWSKGKHTFQFGTNIRFIRNPRSNFINSFSSGTTNASALDTAGLAGTTSPLNPANNGFPAVSPQFGNSYDFPLMTMMGIVSELDATYNFDRTGTPQALGSPVRRRWGADEYEFYFQDSFKAKPNLTLNLGLRYSLFSPPWETNGAQVAPAFSMGQWFKDRGQKMFDGIPSSTDPVVSFDLAGPVNGKKGYYKWDTKNFGPRIAFAYSPKFDSGFLHRIFGDADKSVIRGGFGVVFDRIGSGLLSTFDQRGSFGLSTQLTNSTLPSVSDAPRVTGLNTIPGIEQGFPPPPTGGFPFVPPSGGAGLAIFWGLDDTIRTPYSYNLDFSVGRELAHNMSFEVSYVGRLSRRLLVQEDLAMPLNLVDKSSKISYFDAAKRFSQLARAETPTSAITPSVVGPTAAYWQDLIAPLQSGDAYSRNCFLPFDEQGAPAFTTDPLQAAYDLFKCYAGNETTALFALDIAGSDFPETPDAGILGQSGRHYPTVLGGNAFFNQQFHSLYAWRSIGNSDYHAMQISIRKRMSRGVQFDFNYTLSKSIDLSSDAERIDAWSGLGGQVINSWSPNQLRAISDFDTTHQVNANWIIDLPFGRGKAWAGNAGKSLDALIGGWQLSGLARWTSGFPVSITSGFTWATNWQLGGGAVQTGPVQTGTTVTAEHGANLFKDPQGATGISAFRTAYPGESGQRNTLRGEGFAGFDLGLSKRWKMPFAESNSVQFRWEVFNVPNLHRFDVRTIPNNLDAGPSFGQYSGLLTNPRVMQFALRYEF
ncbi:MAG: TonB-dependent receptor [Acidobacteriia bacterium]|nr:TonB-dependent receptor [Terriglobia bacterium]